jgi:hypothetical protein
MKFFTEKLVEVDNAYFQGKRHLLPTLYPPASDEMPLITYDSGYVNQLIPLIQRHQMEVVKLHGFLGVIISAIKHKVQ